ncbi:MAG: NAD(P)-dependent alcohol dehydrogenase [Muricomes sp.]|uniref:NAD(P)-dependent alcohol dehydrogenase n=1 Tax=Faecalicatena contorta TaxID=39482 RepID=UPI002ECCDD5B|nr:NAD(P)-dependent alcohol dehydrogenase [Muricomes sp.]
MKAAVMKKVKEVVIEERDIPEIGDNEVLIKVKHCGVCGSDIHYYEHGRIGDFVVNQPMVLGHECAGEICKVGDSVKNLKIGDIVAVEPGYTCGKCEYCKSGKYNLCPDVVFLATPPYDGAFAEYLKYPADMVFKLPEGMDTVEGALIEPFCVGMHAAMQAEARVGQTAVILGAGCIGLCTLMALSTMGVKRVYMADIIQSRLDMAMELGAVKAIRADKEDVVQEIMEATTGRGVDLVFETAGSQQTAQQTAELAARGGTIVMVGMAADPVFQYDFGKIMNKEVKLHTVFRYRNLYEAAIHTVADCHLPIKKIVTNMYAFEQTGQALEDSISHKSEMVKSVIEFP